MLNKWPIDASISPAQSNYSLDASVTQLKKEPYFSKRLMMALLASLLLHLASAGRFAFLFPESPARQVIEARLVLPKPIEKPAEKTIEKPIEKPAKKPLIKPPRPKVVPPPEPEPVKSEPIAEVPVKEVPSDAVSPSAAEPSPEPYVDPSANNTIAETVTEPTVAPPAQFEAVFDVSRDGSTLGTTQMRYQTEAGRYTLSTVSEASGLASLFFKGLVQKSEGRINEKGLQPQDYRYEMNKKADKTYHAHFDWQEHFIEMRTSAGNTSAPLTEDAQDLLSFMVQFMYTPPLNTIQIPITTGRKFKVYDYTFDGEEVIETRLGSLNTVHIIHQSEPGEDKTELWLGVDYHHLPVKIRNTDKKGVVIEQIIKKLNVPSTANNPAS